MAFAPAVTTPTNPRPLRIDGLVKRFGKLTAVDGISLELNNGECLGLLGPNGAGKSTLIRTIVGRVIPSAGSVSVFGDPADSIGARVALGWVPQELALYPRCCLLIMWRTPVLIIWHIGCKGRLEMLGSAESCLNWRWRCRSRPSAGVPRARVCQII
jgi:energy-coupling factor transporter ATP-binding protein EcfA2